MCNLCTDLRILIFPIKYNCAGPANCVLFLQYSDKVQSLCYAVHTRQLISCGADGGIVVWNMDVKRQEVSKIIHSAFENDNTKIGNFHLNVSLIIWVLIAVNIPSFSVCCGICSRKYFKSLHL